MFLVTGATGKVGGHVLSGLVAAGLKARVLTRNPAEARFPDGVDVIAGTPSDTDASARALDGAEGVFIVLVGDVEQQARAFGAAMQRAGVPRRVVLLSSSAVSHPVRHPIGEEHRTAERIVGELVPARTVLRPGPYHSNALWWSQTIRTEGRARCLVGNNPGAPIDPADIAAIGVSALIRPEHAGRSYELTGPEVLTSRRQVEIIAELTGQDIRFDVATAAEAVDAFTAISGDRPTATENIAALHSPLVPWAVADDTAARLLGRPLATFRTWAAQNVGAFRRDSAPVGAVNR